MSLAVIQQQYECATIRTSDAKTIRCASFTEIPSELSKLNSMKRIEILVQGETSEWTNSHMTEFLCACVSSLAAARNATKISVRYLPMGSIDRSDFEGFMPTLRTVLHLKRFDMRGCGLSLEQTRDLCEWAAASTQLTCFYLPHVSTDAMLPLGNLITKTLSIVEFGCTFIPQDASVFNEEENDHARHFCESCLRNYTLCKVKLAVDTNISCVVISHLQANIQPILQRNRLFSWHAVHSEIRDIVIAMYAFELPVYVLLWIVDWLPMVATLHREYKKVMLIEQLRSSCAKRVFQKKNGKK